jgi:tetrahydromethanopterin S-methyltransferase subunit G
MPHFPLRTWEDCRLCWEAKGYKLDSITPVLIKLGKYGRSTIATAMNTTEPAPPRVAAAVWALEVLPHASKTKYEIYMRGLEAKTAARPEGEDEAGAASYEPGHFPPPPELSEERLAAIDSKLEETRGRLDDIAGRLEAKLDGAGAQLGAMEGQLTAFSLDMDGKLTTVATHLNHAGAKLSTLATQADELGAFAVKSEAKLNAQVDKLDTLSSKTEGRFETLSGKVEASSAKVEGRLDSLGGKLDTTTARIDGVIGALGNEIEAASDKTGEALGVLGNQVEATSLRMEGVLSALGGKVEAASAMGAEQHKELIARVEDTGHKLDRTETKVEATHVQVAQTEKKVIGKLEWLVLALLAIATIMLVGFAVLLLAYWRAAPALTTLAANAPASSPARESLPAEHESAQEQDDDKSLSTGLDGGTELTKLVTQTLPIPTGGLPGQMTGPCPATADEIDGYCWKKIFLTSADVKDGMCDNLRLYEPSPGWCRSHHAGYKPVFGPRKKDNNTVDPQ